MSEFQNLKYHNKRTRTMLTVPNDQCSGCDQNVDVFVYIT